ncbi:MAG TPA: cupin domain-containing protein, partial [Opitutales bacterium]|nr:cupin domain-containing protein [Opitutales bacterium]
EESENIPNHPNFPVLLYRGALDADEGPLAEAFESCYQKNDWRGAWRWGVYDFHHYHSNAHEVLGVASGEAELKLGGPKGRTVTVRAGDVVVLPAGTGHMNVGSSGDFQVVGAYPAGQENKDLIRNDEPLDDTIRERIKNVARPTADPIFGEDGPLLSEWK